MLKTGSFREGTARKSEGGEGTATEEGAEQKPVLQEIEERFKGRFDELNETAKSLAEKIEEAQASNADDAPDKAKEFSEQLEQLDDTVKSLQADRDREIANAQIETLSGTAKSLGEAIEAARQPHSDFDLGAALSGVSQPESDGHYGRGSEHLFFADAAKAMTSSDKDALERWTESMAEKAMTQSSGSTGGYLVPPQVSDELIRVREQANILRPLLSKIQVNSDVLRIAAQTKGLLAGWVAELAEKPEAELAFGEVSVNVFWKAGMAVVSNQLLRNSNPSIEQLIYNDLGRRLAALEEIAFLSGSGTGQPLGILNTPGVGHNGDAPLTSTDIDDLLDAIIDAITAIHTDYFGAPNAIVMHPRTWARIVKARKEDATAEYLVGPPSSASGGGRDATDPLPGYQSVGNPFGRLFGLPVYTTRNVPTNAGAGDDESRIIVGNFQEGLILDHANVTLDSSEHVYFTTNQTIFRAEDAVGFTAARYPAAFQVIGGTGLANG